MDSLKSTIPFFLVGSVRSGSTFLRLMLDSHPEITNPGECDFLFDCVTDSGAMPDMDSFHHWLSINRIFEAKKLQIDPSLNYLDLIRSFVDQFDRLDSILVMNVHRHFHRIPKIFPTARYIHLLRDPRDVARSCIGMGWVGHVYYGVDIWKEAEMSWDRLKASLSEEQYLEIKYEDLLDDVESELTRICHFLGLEYSPQMMEYAANSTYGLPDKNLSFQWKRSFFPRELQLIEGKVGEMLVSRDYALSGYGAAQPGSIEEIRLILKNKNSRIRHQLNRYGLGLYIQSFLAARTGLVSWQSACQKRKNQIDLEHLK